MSPNSLFKNRFVFFFFNYVLAVTLVLNCSALAFSQKVETDSNVTTGITMPRYQIYSIATAGTSSQAFGISPSGIATGRTITSGGSQIYSWGRNGGYVGHSNLSGRNYCVGNASTQTSPFGMSGANVGTCAATLFGTSRLPVIWRNGVASQLPLPSGETLGDANDINSGDIAVGSVNSGSTQKAVYYSGTTATYISQTTSNGSFFTTAYGINDSNRIVGTGIDPGNAARNVGMVYDFGSNAAFEVGALPGANGALNFAIGNGGHIVGASMLNQGAGAPFIWTQAGGMVAIPLPAGTSQGSARAVNSSGWAVGTASSAFAIPFLYDGTNTYRLQDLIPANSGWDLSMNTSSSAMGISDNNIIVGTGVFNGEVRAYAMVPVLGNLSLGGRVATNEGRGVGNAVLTISGGDLTAPKIAVTNPFGYYRFDGLQSETQYTVTIVGKQFTFPSPTRTVTLTGSQSDYNFAAIPE